MIENRVLFGSVNAHRTDWVAAVEALEAMQGRWPDAMEQLVGLRVEPDRFSEAFGYRGVKATLRSAEPGFSLSERRPASLAVCLASRH